MRQHARHTGGQQRHGLPPKLRQAACGQGRADRANQAPGLGTWKETEAAAIVETYEPHLNFERIIQKMLGIGEFDTVNSRQIAAKNAPEKAGDIQPDDRA
ncbi:MAG TPA: hypothetical protein VGN96_12195 [Roseococcus sp.]|nr:hypothetical protein [Roseococcus sp.]